MDFLGLGRKNTAAVIFTCARSWNGRGRASCTVQNSAIITASKSPAPDRLSTTPEQSAPALQKVPMQHLKIASIRPSKTAQPAGWSGVLRAVALVAASVFSVAPAGLLAKTADGHAAHQTKNKGAKKVTYQRSSSEESSAEHDRRMARECKGLHNAGACRGYTR